jgi:hypothetical protein
LRECCGLDSSMKMTVFWAIVPCCFVEVDWRFRGAYCLHHQGDKYSCVLVRLLGGGGGYCIYARPDF